VSGIEGSGFIVVEESEELGDASSVGVMHRVSVEESLYGS
jgi:hypothetical protein